MPSPLPGFSPADVVDAVDSTAHIIQVALTPVFLLSGIGTLLNVFNMRLGRVSDHAERAAELVTREDDPARRAWLAAHLIRLERRRVVLDVAVMLVACGGAATCGAAFALFVGGLRDSAVASWLFWLFGGALGCTVCALIAFLLDTILAWHGLRREGPLPQSNG